ncbi:hypothetical protein GLOIN_2v1604778 [Rhizophagus irregularis DAOM 181602=DAOM 197198]|uniref:Uncharacterized protein n=1 Tax=Rhizophagus irregularis (strain DAOM 181602 / DAOM 197198 / MUCL 43194) TaxID=747089 RepID=A0A2P4Q1I7_RHIID|nr:hypothetical protein GLOIN_2v1604778 [Rhizophagus irregularis DAOM 181602=DAOM 197198]POG71490.1 hypothetical protein GLOIN_2v1604778 [Rhizophagus irregularis DAOM 181602=DAOM 197198]|eukprot:XP_025178356.1 hypothetical protein GLOIN_2v1604778 [Rhizophagus irregularis DAOM 181602=DAOM 197198]
MLNIPIKLWNGLNMINLKMLNIWQREGLELFLKQFGKMDLLISGIMKMINGKEKLKQKSL